MSDPIGYVKSSGGEVDAAFVDEQRMVFVDDLQDACGLQLIEMETGYYIPTNAIYQTVDLTQKTANTQWRCALLEVSAGDKFTVSGQGSPNSTTRVWCFTDQSGVVKEIWPYYAPGIAEHELIEAPVDGYLILNTRDVLSNSCYNSYRGEFPANRLDTLEAMQSSTYLLNACSYRPLGLLSKGYLILNSDDGQEELVTKTIPVLKQKNVPCVFNLISTSPVLTTDHLLTEIKTMIEDYGCQVAVHGSSGSWNVSDTELVAEIQGTIDTIESHGITPFGAVMPGASASSSSVAHLTKHQMAIVGGMLDVVCEGSIGEDPAVYSDRCNGPRSNVFGLTRLSLVSTSYNETAQKQMIDDAVSNGYLIVLYWHDATLDDDAITRLGNLIDYAKEKLVTICTFKDIPSMI